MCFQVFLTADAAYDLEDLYDYIESHEAPKKADYVLDKIEETFLSLADNPERGTYPNELLTVLCGPTGRYVGIIHLGQAIEVVVDVGGGFGATAVVFGLRGAIAVGVVLVKGGLNYLISL